MFQQTFQEAHLPKILRCCSFDSLPVGKQEYSVEKDTVSTKLSNASTGDKRNANAKLYRISSVADHNHDHDRTRLSAQGNAPPGTV
jgi:hypothetical protein